MSTATMKLADLTKDERSLLLFFETAAVDHAGAVSMEHMNADDSAITARWKTDGFVEFGRISAHSLTRFPGSRHTHYVVLSPEALALAQEERRTRIERLAKNRTWRKAGEA